MFNLKLFIILRDEYVLPIGKSWCLSLFFQHHFHTKFKCMAHRNKQALITNKLDVT